MAIIKQAIIKQNFNELVLREKSTLFDYIFSFIPFLVFSCPPLYILIKSFNDFGTVAIFFRLISALAMMIVFLPFILCGILGTIGSATTHRFTFSKTSNKFIKKDTFIISKIQEHPLNEISHLDQEETTNNKDNSRYHILKLTLRSGEKYIITISSNQEQVHLMKQQIENFIPHIRS